MPGWAINAASGFPTSAPTATRSLPAARAIARSWMSSTPSSTFPLDTSFSESGPAPGLRIVSALDSAM